jgi:hypothetical protein
MDGDGHGRLLSQNRLLFTVADGRVQVKRKNNA